MGDEMRMGPISPEVISGLPGRAHGYKAIRHQVAIAQQDGRPLCAMWIEIDRMPSINQSFGTKGGEFVMAAMIGRLLTVCGDQGCVSRMDSDEILLLLPGMNQDQAVRLAKEIIAESAAPLGIEGLQIHPSISIGIACLEPDEEPLNFLIRADSAMMVAKENFGNTFYLSGEVLAFNAGRAGSKDMEIEASLRTGIQSNGLDLHFQPAVNRGGGIVSVEARMRCNVGGDMVSPSDFIPIAERSELIAKIGNWSLAEGAFFAKHLSDEGWRMPVSINVSRVQLLTPEFVSNLQSALLCANIPPELIEIEITESLYFDLDPTIQRVLKEILGVGVSFAIDDFGTGFSTMTTLRDLPVSKIKLDRSFISPLPDNKRTLSLVSAMVAFCRAMGVTIVAEGVETTEQRDCLLHLGVDILQGYLYCPPLHRDKLIESLQQKVFVPCQSRL